MKIITQKTYWHYGWCYVMMEENGNGSARLWFILNNETDKPFYEVYISDMFVDEEHRRKGIATAIIEKSKELYQKALDEKIIMTDLLAYIGNNSPEWLDKFYKKHNLLVKLYKEHN